MQFFRKKQPVGGFEFILERKAVGILVYFFESLQVFYSLQSWT